MLMSAIVSYCDKLENRILYRTYISKTRYQVVVV